MPIPGASAAGPGDGSCRVGHAGSRAPPAYAGPIGTVEENTRPRAAIALAASAGGVEALSDVIGGLPPDIPAAVLVVLHVTPIGPSVLPSILSRHGHLPAMHPADGELLHEGNVYVAPPDRHLVVIGDRAHISVGPRENGSRPSADPLFRSVARAYGRHAAGVVLSGALDDGTAGLAAIKRAGGLTIAQDPDEAAFPGMPAHAISYVRPDHVARLAEIPGLLVDFATAPAVDVSRPPPPSGFEGETQRADPPSTLTCPECGGTLWVAEESPLRFRCRVGHTFSPESLLIGKQDALEAALWAAIVALEERVDLSRRLLRREEVLGNSRLARRYLQDVEDTNERVGLLKQLAEQLTVPADVAADPLEAGGAGGN